MKNPTVTILVGKTLSGEEASFLCRLCADLAPIGALIFANFYVGCRQIDFFVVTEFYAALIELKNAARPIMVFSNGVCKAQDANGVLVDVPGNPWQQALDQAHALSDAMRKYAKDYANVPERTRAEYYYEFASYVCVVPLLHPGSELPDPNAIVTVRAYTDILERIRTKKIKTNWRMSDWELFATRNLHLTRTELHAAIDPKAFAAQAELAGYRQRLKSLLSSDLAPLLKTNADDYGAGVGAVARLRGPLNYFVTGPSGAAKTFHLHHLASALAAGTSEVPFVIDAKLYRGGEFWPLIRKAVAPCYSGDPQTLLDAMQPAGFNPVLLLDALNECPPAHRDDLLKGVQAFALHYGARTIVVAQEPNTSLGGLKAENVPLRLPTTFEKRNIYAYHARIPVTPDLDGLCSSFTNAQDLAVAGRCHRSGPPPKSRAELYDRYLTESLRSDHSVVASALLRHLADYMNTSVAFALPRITCDEVAGAFLTKHQAPLGILDSIFQSRLVEVTSDSFAFEHEMVFAYLKAEQLRRSTATATDLATELQKPRNVDLLEFVLPRYTLQNDVVALVSAASSVDVLAHIHAGRCGPVAQTTLRTECKQLVEAAIADLPNITLGLTTTPVGNGKRLVTDIPIQGHRPWLAADALRIELLAHTVDDPESQSLFFRLLDATEWTLNLAAVNLTKRTTAAAKTVWSETLRLYGGGIHHSTMVLPCATMLAALHTRMMHRELSVASIRSRLLERVHQNPSSAMSSLLLLEDRAAKGSVDDVSNNLDLLEQALNSGIAFLGMRAVEFLFETRGTVERAGEAALARARAIVAAIEFDDANPMLNTIVAETKIHYEVMESPVDADTAFKEMQAVIGIDDETAGEIARAAGVDPSDLRANSAHSLLANIFEDIFNGAYYEAYQLLSHDDKIAILTLASNATQAGFCTDWILQELLQINDRRTLPVFEKFAVTIERDSLNRQDAVAHFVLGVVGCARWLQRPPVFVGDGSPDAYAWEVIAEQLFWLYRGASTRQGSKQTTWHDLEGDARLAAGIAFHDLETARWKLTPDECQSHPDLVEHYPEEFQTIAEYCLANRKQLAARFSRHNRDESVIKYLIATLGSLATTHSREILQELVADPVYGRAAIDALKSLQSSTG
jgi:hypothetical protein